MFTQGGAASQLGLALIDTHFEKRFEPDDRRPAITAWAGQRFKNENRLATQFFQCICIYAKCIRRSTFFTAKNIHAN